MLLMSSKSCFILKEDLKIFALCKTWLSSSIPSDLFYISAFQHFSISAFYISAFSIAKICFRIYLRTCLHGGGGPQTGRVTCGGMGHPTYHVNVIKLKWEIIWTGWLPHLPGVSHLHVNRHLGWLKILTANPLRFNLLRIIKYKVDRTTLRKLAVW